MSNEKTKTVVSVTPLRAEADSRAFKVAASIARFGYNSILVEAERSDLDKDRLPFRLLSMRDDTKHYSSMPKYQTNVSSSGAVNRRVLETMEIIRNSLLQFPDPLKGLLRPLVKLLIFLFRYGYYSCVLPLRSIPRASLYYLHSYSLFPALYILSKKYRAPLVYDAHDFYPGIKSPEEIRLLKFEQRWTIAFCQNIESRLIKYASNVITVSGGVARLQRETFGCNATVVRNCHDFRLDQEPSTDIRSTLGLSPDKFLLVVVGNAKQGMAIQEVLDALAELPHHVHLVFLGKFYEQRLSNLCGGALGGRIHVVSPMKPYEVVPFIRTADASIIIYYPRSVNYQHCLPNGFFQSVAAELPILYPELPEIQQIAEKYMIGIPISPRVPRSISAAVNRLLNDPNLLATYRRNLREIREELSWEKEEVILRELISKALQ